MTSKPKSSRTESPETCQQNQPSASKKRGRPPGKTTTRRPIKTFSPEQKAQAVLAAWTEKVSQSEICRQMQINYVTFQNWQDRAMEGMLRALDNQMRLEDTSVLNPRLRKIMERGRRVPEDRLGRRLLQIQQERDITPPV